MWVSNIWRTPTLYSYPSLFKPVMCGLCLQFLVNQALLSQIPPSPIAILYSFFWEIDVRRWRRLHGGEDCRKLGTSLVLPWDHIQSGIDTETICAANCCVTLWDGVCNPFVHNTYLPIRCHPWTGQCLCKPGFAGCYNIDDYDEDSLPQPHYVSHHHHHQQEVHHHHSGLHCHRPCPVYTFGQDCAQVFTTLTAIQ